MHKHVHKLGMVGGGQGAFIGGVHRIAAQLDHRAVLVAGALSSTPEKSRASASALGLAIDRGYATWRAMLEGEKLRPVRDRVNVVSIVTPNDTHYEIALAFVEAGFHVVCDKPLATTLEQAQGLAHAVSRAGTVFGVTYNYSGYPMVKQARALIERGELGTIRKVCVEYAQGWLASALETSGQKQASWRTDPARSGGGGAIGDIGTHAEHLVRFVTGLEIESVAADLTSFVPGRRVDDDASVLIRFASVGNGPPARGILHASQVCVGEENNLSLRVYGTHGGLVWRQEDPDSLVLQTASDPRRVLRRGGAGLCPTAVMATRLPGGHPEGFLEAFANIYRGVYDAIDAQDHAGAEVADSTSDYPSVGEGVEGVRFVGCVLKSAAADGAWVKLRS